MDLREALDRMSNRAIFLNLLITQSVLFGAGWIIYVLFLDTMSVKQLLHTEQIRWAILTGVGFAVIVIGLDLLFMRILPKHHFDDGGVNERIFRDVNIWQIMLIAGGVAVAEEWLFRAVLQNLFGLVPASLLFALIHFRYLRKSLFMVLIFLISFGFGFLYEWTNSIWSVVTAHFLIDFTLGCLIRYRPFTFLADKNVYIPPKE